MFRAAQNSRGVRPQIGKRIEIGEVEVRETGNIGKCQIVSGHLVAGAEPMEKQPVRGRVDQAYGHCGGSLAAPYLRSVDSGLGERIEDPVAMRIATGHAVK